MRISERSRTDFDRAKIKLTGHFDRRPISRYFDRRPISRCFEPWYMAALEEIFTCFLS